MNVKSKIENWPVIWRVVAPGAGSYDHDMVYLETESEPDAVKQYTRLRRGGSPSPNRAGSLWSAAGRLR